jgi:hypothetical protein
MSRTNITDLPTSRAIYTPSESTTFTLMTPGQTTTYTFTAIPRQFRPGFANVYFPLGVSAGITVTPAAITGTALGGWTATFSLVNNTSSDITPASQQVVIYQLA